MELSFGWRVLGTPPGGVATAEELDRTDGGWQAAIVPGTAAGAIGDDGRDFDAEDWWFQCEFLVPAEVIREPVTLELGGIATVSEVYLNGTLITTSTSMWQTHAVDVTPVIGEHNELVIACRALTPLLARPRRPRARWRTRVVNATNLRWYRTMVFGRSPGFASGPAPVGPWREIRLLRSPPGAPSGWGVRARMDGANGMLTVRAAHPDGAAEPRWTVTIAGRRVQARMIGERAAEAVVEIQEPARWWPHTHGTPTLHDVAIEIDGETLYRCRVGFRSLGYPADIAGQGFALDVNEVPVFVRGAVWTPADLLTMAPRETTLRALLTRVRDAGMNLLRVPGTGAYESDAFYDLCDELGIMVWQDLMFANLDYPLEDPEFAAVATAEARDVIARLAHRPSLVTVCGNSEVEQQPAMMGLDPTLGCHPFWERTVPALLRGAGSDAAYVRSTPFGGDLPFHPSQGVTHYFGVSGYFHSAQAARRAEVSFASECLAFANVPDEVEVPAHHPRWKQGVQRDAGTGWDIGAGWDFDDVRDHYVEALYGIDTVQLRRSDHARYLELGRAATGEVMADVIGEWRRERSPCQGALVLWLKDMQPGAGLGVLDHHGAPKVAYHHLRRAMAPVAVWSSDEDLAGVLVHVANDRPEPLSARLRISLYRDGDVQVAEAEEPLYLGVHSMATRSVEGMLGRFVDAAWAYRFGPPVADVLVATLESDDGDRVHSQTFRFLSERPLRREPLAELGLRAHVRPGAHGASLMRISSRRFAYGVRVGAVGFDGEDDAFSLEPGHEREIRFDPQEAGVSFTGATLTALNLADPLHVPSSA